MSTSNYWASENGSAADNVFMERVRTYSPMTKAVHVLDNPAPLSPASPASGYQSVVWAQEPQVMEEAQSPGPYKQETIRRYIVQNSEQQQVQSPGPYTQETVRRYMVQNNEQQQVQSPGPYTQETVRRYVVQNNEQQQVQSPGPYTQGTVRRYVVQNNEQQEVMSPGPYTQETVRRYIVQNPEQQDVSQGTIRRYIVQNPEQQDVQHETVRRYIVQNPDQSYMKGINYMPSNSVIYEKTYRRLDGPESGQMVQRSSVSSSVNEQVIEQNNNQSKVSIQSTENVVTENIQQKVSSVQTEQVKRRNSSISGPEQLDARYFGELLAELSRKNNDLHGFLLQHVEKIGARKPSDSDYQEDIESLIPKGVSELTKQQIRYLLQMRQTSDKSMKLVLATFSSLREELGHLQEDLSKLEIAKKSLESDLSFKNDQIREYETMLASLREKNRLLQQELKESQMKLRSLDETITSLRNADSDKDYRLKELEYTRNALQQENKTLRVQVSETVSNPMLQAKTDEITRHYKEMIESLREEKDKEIRSLRTQITKFQHDMTTRQGSSSDLQMKLLELTSSLEERDAQIKRQQEELFRLRQQRDVSKNVTKEIITRKYSTQYPILRLLNDYKETPGMTTSQTFVMERRSDA